MLHISHKLKIKASIWCEGPPSVKFISYSTSNLVAPQCRLRANMQAAIAVDVTVKSIEDPYRVHTTSAAYTVSEGVSTNALRLLPHQIPFRKRHPERMPGNVDSVSNAGKKCFFLLSKVKDPGRQVRVTMAVGAVSVTEDGGLKCVLNPLSREDSKFGSARRQRMDSNIVVEYFFQGGSAGPQALPSCRRMPSREIPLINSLAATSHLHHMSKN